MEEVKECGSEAEKGGERGGVERRRGGGEKDRGSKKLRMKIICTGSLSRKIHVEARSHPTRAS